MHCRSGIWQILRMRIVVKIGPATARAVVLLVAHLATAHNLPLSKHFLNHIFSSHIQKTCFNYGVHAVWLTTGRCSESVDLDACLRVLQTPLLRLSLGNWHISLTAYECAAWTKSEIPKANCTRSNPISHRRWCRPDWCQMMSSRGYLILSQGVTGEALDYSAAQLVHTHTHTHSDS